MFVTVDWDFFFNPKLEWDFLYGVGRLYQTSLWNFRDANHKRVYGEWLHDEYLPDFYLIDEFNTYIDKAINKKTEISIVQSHFQVLTEIPIETKQLINFDSHWDVRYPSFKEKFLSNENWLSLWLKANSDNMATVVYSPHTFEEPTQNIPDEFKDQLVLLTWDEWEKLDHYKPINHVNYCLSPEWTPSWCDNDFLSFIQNIWSLNSIKDITNDIIREYSFKDTFKIFNDMPKRMKD